MTRRWRSRSAARDEDGAMSVEYIALLPILLVVAVLAIQVLTIVAAGAAATTAARDGSRAHGVEGADCGGAVTASLPSWLRDGHSRDCGSETVRVRVAVPNLFPGVSWPQITIERAATLPDTSA